MRECKGTLNEKAIKSKKKKTKLKVQGKSPPTHEGDNQHQPTTFDDL